MIMQENVKNSDTEREIQTINSFEWSWTETCDYK